MADESQPEAAWHRPWTVAAIVAAAVGALVTGVTGLPHGAGPIPAIARHAMQIALPKWGTTEAVNEIVYGSRGWDTFGETFLLLAAVVAVVLLSRNREARAEYVGEASAGRTEQRGADPRERAGRAESRARRAEAQEESENVPPAPQDPDANPLGEPAPERAAGMTVAVRVGARAAAPILAVAAVYLAAWGYTPGGGFPAGAALAGVAILMYAALGHRAVAPVVRPSVLEPIEMLGAAMIIAIGLISIAREGSFLANWVPLAPQQTIRSGGTIQLFSLSELIEVVTGLTIAIFALLGARHEWSPDEAEDGEQEKSP